MDDEQIGILKDYAHLGVRDWNSKVKATTK
jgi:hypothetical protein